MKNPTSLASVLNAYIICLERRFEEAITEIEGAITQNPSDARSNWSMARVLNAGGRPEEAIEHAKMALRIDPGCVY
jgi:tetratricopeptide (TPR) repeat protein